MFVMAVHPQKQLNQLQHKVNIIMGISLNISFVLLSMFDCRTLFRNWLFIKKVKELVWTCMRYLLVQWARQTVGHERSVSYSIHVLHQVVKEVTVGTSEKSQHNKKIYSFLNPLNLCDTHKYNSCSTRVYLMCDGTNCHCCLDIYSDDISLSYTVYYCRSTCMYKNHKYTISTLSSVGTTSILWQSHSTISYLAEQLGLFHHTCINELPTYPTIA